MFVLPKLKQQQQQQEEQQQTRRHRSKILIWGLIAIVTYQFIASISLLHLLSIPSLTTITIRSTTSSNRSKDGSSNKKDNNHHHHHDKMRTECSDSTTKTLITPSPPIWTWYYYSRRSSNATTTTTTTTTDENGIPTPRVLLAQYSALDGTYSRLLNATQPVNHAYAQMHSYDYVIVQGTTLWVLRDYIFWMMDWAWKTILSIIPKTIGTNPKNCPNHSNKIYNLYHPPEARSRFTKISILQHALEKKNEYDYVVLLDADAMMVNFTLDITTLLPNHKLVAAHRVQATDPYETWDINNGVTIWSVQSPLFPTILSEWKAASKWGLFFRDGKSGDQFYLQRTIKKKSNRIQKIHALPHEFQYRNGTVIKHFIREQLQWNQDDIWKQTSLDQRCQYIQTVIEQELCPIYSTWLQTATTTRQLCRS